MPKVVVLDKDVADKIAAGEVVDRPASIVKELVENSIDAGSTRVEVDLEDGGKRRITITDNGCGMALEDAVLSLERHATSKIRSAEDLFSIRTLGFRGEALPSIAAVSNLRIQTCAQGEDAGVELAVERGQVSAAEQRGAAGGTRITVTDLFYNVPARLKFLKATQTELSQIVDLMVRFALSYPGVHFKLAHNGRQVFSSPGSGDALNTVVAAYGREVAREMLPVSAGEGSPVSVRGFVSRPAVTRSGRMHQSFFVNGRVVRTPILSRALDEAYKGYIPAGRHPVACLFVTVDPASVDVNVHPTKMEVRFSSDREVFDAALRAVRMALAAANLAMPAFAPRVEGSLQAQSAAAAEDPFAVPEAAAPARAADPFAPQAPRAADAGTPSPGYAPAGGPDPFARFGPGSAASAGRPRESADLDDPFADDAAGAPARAAGDDPFAGTPPTGGEDPFADGQAREVAAAPGYQASRGMPPLDSPPGSPAWNLRPAEQQASLGLDYHPFGAQRPAAGRQGQPATDVAEAALAAPDASVGNSLPDLKPVARVLDTYVVCEGPGAIYIIDQHAAHERILYDALRSRGSDDVAPQQLLIPLTLSLSHVDAALLEQHRETLAGLGFEIEPFGRDTYVLRTVPMLLVGKNYASVLQDVLDDLREKERTGRMEDERLEVCALLACHSVTRSGDPLSPEEMRQLVQDLRESPAPYTCAHGRPTMLVLSRGELERKIGR